MGRDLSAPAPCAAIADRCIADLGSIAWAIVDCEHGPFRLGSLFTPLGRFSCPFRVQLSDALVDDVKTDTLAEAAFLVVRFSEEGAAGRFGGAIDDNGCGVRIDCRVNDCDLIPTPLADTGLKGFLAF